MREDFTAFTIVSKEDGNYFDLLASAKRWGWPLKTIFLSPLEQYEDWINTKHLLIRDQLLGLQTRYFLYLDGWDTIFTGPPGEELELRPYHLTFSGSNECWPEARYAPLFTSGPYPYLNSGVIWGDSLTYSLYCPLEKVCDQLAWTRVVAADQLARFSIDSHYKVAATIFREPFSNWTRKEGRWLWAPTGTSPLIVHAAGKQPLPGCLLV